MWIQIKDFLGVAWATTSESRAKLDDIRIVRDWTNVAGMTNLHKVPSVISYSPSSPKHELQWGASLSPEATTMINTKLELDLLDNKSEELELIIQALDGMDNLNFEKV